MRSQNKYFRLIMFVDYLWDGFRKTRGILFGCVGESVHREKKFHWFDISLNNFLDYTKVGSPERSY